MASLGTVRPKFYTAPGGFGGAMPSLILLRKVLATLDRARRENRPYWFALTVPFTQNSYDAAGPDHYARQPLASGNQGSSDQPQTPTMAG